MLDRYVHTCQSISTVGHLCFCRKQSIPVVKNKCPFVWGQILKRFTSLIWKVVKNKNAETFNDLLRQRLVLYYFTGIRGLSKGWIRDIDFIINKTNCEISIRLWTLVFKQNKTWLVSSNFIEGETKKKQSHKLIINHLLCINILGLQEDSVRLGINLIAHLQNEKEIESLWGDAHSSNCSALQSP